MASSYTPRCKNLVLDAGPLLSLSPLRGLAEAYITAPQVLAELKDKRAREHFERLGLNAGVRIEVRSPDATSLAHVVQFAKKTGDYAVLSHADLCVLALTYSLHEQAKRETEKKDLTKDDASTEDALTDAPPAILGEPAKSTIQESAERTEEVGREESEEVKDEDQDGEGPQEDEQDPEEPEIPGSEENEQDLEPLDVELHRESEDGPGSDVDPIVQPTAPTPGDEPLFEDPSDSDDGEGEWITPVNVSLHKSRALDLLPSASKGGKTDEIIGAGCMTGDFAMQNVLLQMGLSLVGVEGKRIDRVKSWVLRCHACFKICKDSTRKFCPSCGNPTLLRASVTISSPTASTNTPTMQVHLKRNFQYKTRGTIYSIPAPKPGSAKKGSGEGLILREDQTKYVRAKKYADGKKEREERRMTKGILGASREAGVVGVGSWMDPDWTPEMLSVGAGGKGRSVRYAGEMPAIGYGRKNPNERKKRK